jgi:hypothetical protein
MQCLASSSRSLSARLQASRGRASVFSVRSFGTREADFSYRPVQAADGPDAFAHAYQQAIPARLSHLKRSLPPACSKWFVHDEQPGCQLVETQAEEHGEINLPATSELLPSFWAEHESTFVPLEVTTRQDGEGETFECIEAPLKILLDNLSNPAETASDPETKHSIYLAQCDLSSLPPSLQADVPVPDLILPSSLAHRKADASMGSLWASIKGDIYASSLWLGRPPTYTPLHRDPNPNLFIQLAGRKTIRLLPPMIGDALYEQMMTRWTPHSSSISSKIRGEEMMVGVQKAALHEAIWEQPEKYGTNMQQHILETTVALGDALFIPKGWWHSVKGVGTGVTASVNWWFR